MLIDEALKAVLLTMDGILIPGSESGKMEAAKNSIRAVIASIEKAREQEQRSDGNG